MSLRKHIITALFLLFQTAGIASLAQDRDSLDVSSGVIETAVVVDSLSAGDPAGPSVLTGSIQQGDATPLPSRAKAKADKRTNSLGNANRWGVTTNLVDYLNLFTLNAEMHVALARHLAIGVEARYNNWNYNTKNPSKQLQNRKLSAALTARCYFWYVYTGWFLRVKAQYQIYNRTNFLSFKAKEKYSEEGDAYGLGLGIGYDYMIHPHINLEFGAGFWSGYKTYTRYDCAVCGLVTGNGAKGFITLDNVFVAIQFVF